MKIGPISNFRTMALKSRLNRIKANIKSGTGDKPHHGHDYSPKKKDEKNKENNSKIDKKAS